MGHLFPSSWAIVFAAEGSLGMVGKIFGKADAELEDSLDNLE
jgi:hypothetical protein